MEDIETLLEGLDLLWQNYTNCRAHFPYVTKDSVGAKAVQTAPYYIKQGFDITFVFSEGLCPEEIDHWIRQNFIIRLCALLESFSVLSKQISIDFSLDGAEHVNIVRRLRHCFAYSSGRFYVEDDEHRKAIELMRDHLGISMENGTTWPLAIDTVLEPLLQGCRRYAKNKLESA
jgi:hypothetical protein